MFRHRWISNFRDEKVIYPTNGNKNKILEIRTKQLVGIELRHDMFALCCANMIIRGDGKSRLFNGSSLDKTITKKIMKKNRPNIGFINPPYSQGKDDENELNFILQMLNTLRPEGYGVAIVLIKLAGKKDFIEKENQF